MFTFFLCEFNSHAPKSFVQVTEINHPSLKKEKETVKQLQCTQDITTPAPYLMDVII